MSSDIEEQLRRTLGGTYTLEHELGGAGMSRVFVAEELSLGRKVVVKVLPPELAATVNIERFRREIQLAARLQHPNIIPVLAAGISDGLPYYTMPFIEGESLRARLQHSGELPVNEGVKILSDVLSALEYAHAHGIVHRDIKPENILLTGHHAVVADFGVAKALSAATNSDATLTSKGIAIGTPAYMAPEQAVADPTVDQRADLYAVGAIAYEMLTGSHVFSGRPPQAILAAHATEPPESLAKRRPSVPAALASLIMRALEKRPADRPQSAGEMLAALEGVPTQSGATSSPAIALPAQSTSKSDYRGPSLAVAAAILLLLLTSSTWYWYRNNNPAASLASSEISPSLAVLPFENLGTPDDAYFADGMAEEISTKLGALSGLRVIGRQSARSYAHSVKPIPQIGQELGVAYILVGSVRWDHSQPGRNVVRISPALLRASDGTQLWSGPYEGQYVGVLAMQSKVAQRVASALQLQLSVGDRRSLAARPTKNPEAYNLYLRALAFDRSVSMDDALAAVPLLERATALDPGFAVAFAALGRAQTDAFWTMADIQNATTASAKNLALNRQRLRLAKAAIDSAFRLDEHLAEAHSALGNYYYHGLRDYDRALAEFQTVLRLAPNDVMATALIALVERRQGRWAEALVGFQRVRQLDPKNLRNLRDVTLTLTLMRDYVAADSIARLVISLEPRSVQAHRDLANARVLAGDVPGTLAALRGARQVLGSRVFADGFTDFAWPAMLDPVLGAALHDARSRGTLRDRMDRAFAQANLALYENQQSKARAFADSMIALGPALLNSTVFDSGIHQEMAFAYAVRGEKEMAISEAQRSLDQIRSTGDAVLLAGSLPTMGFVAALVGDNERAVEAFRQSLSTPSWVSRPYLRIDPLLADLRKDPSFQALLAGE